MDDENDGKSEDRLGESALHFVGGSWSVRLHVLVRLRVQGRKLFKRDVVSDVFLCWRVERSGRYLL